MLQGVQLVSLLHIEYSVYSGGGHESWIGNAE